MMKIKTKVNNKTKTNKNISKNYNSNSFQNLYKSVIHEKAFLNKREREQILNELEQFYPIWEMRYSNSNPPPEDSENRQLLRPVYWLGNWQFACLNYYHPPQGLHHRCVEAEPFPTQLQNLVDRIEALIKAEINPRDIPTKWQLNTCLINYYGDKIEANNKRIDSARVGEHKDFEPGPVASISFGEKALFQFVESKGKMSQSQVVLQQWLEDCDLQIFAGDKFKKKLFHRVQRVEDKSQKYFNKHHTENFEVRRINLTFRYVPREHFYSFKNLPENKKQDILPYIEELAKQSHFWKQALL